MTNNPDTVNCTFCGDTVHRPNFSTWAGPTYVCGDCEGHAFDGDDD